jgi:hypothetical protein
MIIPSPYLYDETQEVARAYDAACTPDFTYLIARTNLPRPIDDSRPRNGIPLTGRSMREAIDALEEK